MFYIRLLSSLKKALDYTFCNAKIETFPAALNWDFARTKKWKCSKMMPVAAQSLWLTQTISQPAWESWSRGSLAKSTKSHISALTPLPPHSPQAKLHSFIQSRRQQRGSTGSRKSPTWKIFVRDNILQARFAFVIESAMLALSR